MSPQWDVRHPREEWASARDTVPTPGAMPSERSRHQRPLAVAPRNGGTVLGPARGSPPGITAPGRPQRPQPGRGAEPRGHGDSVTRPEGRRDRLPRAPLALLVARLSGGMLRTPKDEARAGQRRPDEGLRGLDEARGGLGRHSVSAPCGPPADAPPADPASLPVGDCSAHECTGLKVPRTAPEQRGCEWLPSAPAHSPPSVGQLRGSPAR